MKLIVILGPTASGKTRLATHLADKIHVEIISADSRQVYKGMDIGTGKDLSEYEVDGRKIPYHLIDIVPAGTKYNISEYQKDFQKVYDRMSNTKEKAIVVGGTGMYVEAVLKNYSRTSIPIDTKLRDELEKKGKEELLKLLNSINRNKTEFDTSTKKRLIRAIEICQSGKTGAPDSVNPIIAHKIFIIKLKRELILKRIYDRLIHRLENGMIEEVEGLLQKGISPEDLKYYGLEYKIITEYLEGQHSYGEMVEKLNIGIRQYAKRQMTWFRRMERSGFDIIWINGELPLEEQIKFILKSNI